MTQSILFTFVGSAAGYNPSLAGALASGSTGYPTMGYPYGY